MFNRRMEELIGVPAAEALGRLPSEIRSPDVVGNSDRHHRAGGGDRQAARRASSI